MLSSIVVLGTTGNDGASADGTVPRTLRTPITENAVEKSVKKNPATTTAPTFKTLAFVVDDERKEEECAFSSSIERTRKIHLKLCEIPLQVKLTSNEEPRLCASGNVTKDGTKKTGNHLAKTAAPGLNKLYTPSPSDSFTVPSVTKSVNSVPHPASDDGNDMDRDLSSLRNPMSSATRATVDEMEVISEGLFVAGSGTSLAAGHI